MKYYLTSIWQAISKNQWNRILVLTILVTGISLGFQTIPAEKSNARQKLHPNSRTGNSQVQVSKTDRSQQTVKVVKPSDARDFSAAKKMVHEKLQKSARGGDRLDQLELRIIRLHEKIVYIENQAEPKQKASLEKMCKKLEELNFLLEKFSKGK